MFGAGDTMMQIKCCNSILPAVILEALNILLGSGWSASERLTQCREAREPGGYADCWEDGLVLWVRCVTPD